MTETGDQPDNDALLVVYTKDGREVARLEMTEEEAFKLMEKVTGRPREEVTLLAIPLLSEKTGVPERTLRLAFDRNEIPYEYIGKKIRASTIANVEAWKNNPQFHRRGPKNKVSKKSD